MSKDQTEENSVTVTGGKLNLIEKIRYLKKTITLEPMLFFYQMALCLSKPALDNLELEKACRVVLNYSDVICDSILEGNHGNYTSENDGIQVVISTMHSWQQPMQSVMPLVLSLFLGSFSDRYKLRKPFFLVPIIGEMCGNIGCLFCVLYMKLWSLNVQGVFQRVVPSLFGGQSMLIMATTAYVADNSSIEMRTLRLGIVQLVISITSPVVNSFSGILFLQIGYSRILNISILLLMAAFFYGLFFVKEYKTQCDEPLTKMLLNIFDINYPLATIKVMFKKGNEVSRRHLLMIIAVIVLQRAAYEGKCNSINSCHIVS